MSEPSNATAALGERRREIERIDRQLVELLAERLRTGRDIGALKREAGLPTLDPAREAEVIRRAGELARTLDIPSEPVRAIFWQIIGLSRRAQVDEG
jgi:chorismate mutase